MNQVKPPHVTYLSLTNEDGSPVIICRRAILGMEPSDDGQSTVLLMAGATNVIHFWVREPLFEIRQMISRAAYMEAQASVSPLSTPEIVCPDERRITGVRSLMMTLNLREEEAMRIFEYQRMSALNKGKRPPGERKSLKEQYALILKKRMTMEEVRQPRWDAEYDKFVTDLYAESLELRKEVFNGD